MMHIQNNAEVAVKEMLKEVAMKVNSNPDSDVALYAKDSMDDGSCISLTVTISKQLVRILSSLLLTLRKEMY